MMRYVVWFAYDGTRYHGWQIQPNGVTVQQVLQEALSRLLKTDITVVGAGRTDSGVHARQMAAHFDVEQALDGKNLAYRLNRILPYDVKVYDVCQVPELFHARFSAIKRTYHYYIHTHRNPFHRFYSLEMPYQLDLFMDETKREKIKKMDQVADEIRGRFGYQSIQRAFMYQDKILAQLNAKEHTVHPQAYFHG